MGVGGESLNLSCALEPGRSSLRLHDGPVLSRFSVPSEITLASSIAGNDKISRFPGLMLCVVRILMRHPFQPLGQCIISVAFDASL